MQSRFFATVLFVLTLLFLAAPSPALAAPYEQVTKDGGVGINAWGTYAYIEVGSPHVHVLKVCSVYVYKTTQAGLYYAEMGWCKGQDTGDGNPHYFYAYRYPGSGGQVKAHLGTAGPGYSHGFKVKYYADNDWGWYLDGNLKETAYVPFHYGFSLNSCEANWRESEDHRDSNYGHFENVKYMDNGAVWHSWTDLTQCTYLNVSPDDPDYRYSTTTPDNEWYSLYDPRNVLP